MSRRLPLCALCGRKLATGRVLICWDKLPGQPEVGWCWAESGECDGTDEIRRLWKTKDWTPEGVLAEIEARGPGRVVRNKKRRSS